MISSHKSNSILKDLSLVKIQIHSQQPEDISSVHATALNKFYIQNLSLLTVDLWNSEKTEALTKHGLMGLLLLHNFDKEFVIFVITTINQIQHKDEQY